MDVGRLEEEDDSGGASEREDCKLGLNGVRKERIELVGGVG